MYLLMCKSVSECVPTVENVKVKANLILEQARKAHRWSTYTALLCNLLNLRLTLCTASFNIPKFFVLPTMHLCVLCGSENKQRLFPYTALADWFV